MTKKYKRIILICLTLTLSICLFGAALDLIISVSENYNYTLSTDDFTIGGYSNTDTNYKSYVTEAGAVTYIPVYRNHMTNDVEISEIDLLIYSDKEITEFEPADSSYYSASETFTLSGETAYLYRRVKFTDLDTLVGASTTLSQAVFQVKTAESANIRVVALPSGKVGKGDYIYNNVYVDSLFSLKLANNENKQNDSLALVGKTREYKNVFLLCDLTISEDFTFTSPSYFNLLYANLTINNAFKINHTQRGLYAFDFIPNGDEYRVIFGTDGSFTIDAPQAYYRTAELEAYIVQADRSKLVYIKTNLDLTATGNSEILAAILADADTYAKNCVEDIVFDNFYLPKSYHAYDISYTWTTSPLSSEENYVSVTRAATNTAVTLGYTITCGYDQSTSNGMRGIIVVGTGVDSLTEAVSVKIKNYLEISAHQTTAASSDNIGKIDLSTKIELLKPIYDLINYADGIIFKFTISDNASLRFISGNAAHSAINNSETEVFYVRKASNVISLSFDNTTYYTLGGTEQLLLSGDAFIIDGSIFTLGISASSDVGTIESATVTTLSYELVGMSQSDINRYLETLIELPYFTTASDKRNLLQVYDGNLYNGKHSGDGVTPVSTAFGIDKISYKVILVPTTEYSALLETSTSGIAAKITQLIEDYTATGLWGSYDNIGATSGYSNTSEIDGNFTFDGENFDGKFYIDSLELLRVDSDHTLLLFYDIQNLVGDNYVSVYSTYRQVFLSASGVGGGDLAQYLKGDTFSSQFNGITDNRLIDPEAQQNENFTNVFASDNSQIKLLMLAFDGDTLLTSSDFCYLSATETIYNRQYNIVIEPSLLPEVNKTVTITAIFYNVADGTQYTSFNSSNYDNPPTGVDIISSQTYSFVVPGVYAVAKFNEELFNKIYESGLYSFYTIGEGNTAVHYLYADSAKSTVAELDCTKGATDNSISTLTGINYLTNTASFIFDDNTFTDISALALLSENAITSISLNNCGLTDAIIGNNLVSLTSLVSADLSNNDITTLLSGGSSILYRTVKTLKLNGNSNLSTISGISKLNELTSLEIKSCNIADFRPLLDLNELSEVYLYGNTNDFVHDGDTTCYLGTSGIANISIYVALADKSVTVYTGQDSVFESSADERLGALALNAIIIQTKHYGALNFPSSLGITSSTSANTYTVTTAYVLSGMTVVTSYANATEYNVILTITVGTDTIARMFTIIYYS